MDFHDFPRCLGKSGCRSHTTPQDMCEPTPTHQRALPGRGSGGLRLRSGLSLHRSRRHALEIQEPEERDQVFRLHLALLRPELLGGCMRSTPRFPKTPWEIMKIHDFS